MLLIYGTLSVHWKWASYCYIIILNLNIIKIYKDSVLQKCMLYYTDITCTINLFCFLRRQKIDKNICKNKYMFEIQKKKI